MKISQVFNPMVAGKLPFAEGVSINIPTLFSRVKCPFWKVGMKNIIDSLDRSVWDAIVRMDLMCLKLL